MHPIIRVADRPTQTIVVRNPSQRSIAGALAFIASDPTEVAKVISPLSAAVMPKPSCSIIGSRNGTAPTEIRDNVPAITEIRKVGIRISRKSSTGCGWRRA
jgi:hypothetical protein